MQQLLVNSTFELITDGEVKIKGDHGWEVLCKYFVQFFVIMLLLSVFESFQEKQLQLTPIYVYSALSVVSWLIFLLTENCYLLDFNQQKVIYRHHFMKSKKHVLTSFSDILAVSVDGRYHFNGRHLVWRYRVALVRKNGVVYRVTNVGWLQENNEMAQLLADALGVKYISGRSQQTLCIKKNKNREEIVFVDSYKALFPGLWIVLFYFVLIFICVYFGL